MTTDAPITVSYSGQVIDRDEMTVQSKVNGSVVEKYVKGGQDVVAGPHKWAVSRGKKFDFDTSETWLDLFKRQVDKNPNHIAVADDDSAMTYAELDAQSDKIAVWLFNEGVQENEFVAIRMGRTKNFFAAVLGVQKIGAAYVPIDLDYPAGRVAYMLNDSRAKITLTDELVAKILSSEIESKKFFKTTPENFAYMIYTSGSTGKPKGVVIQHKALLNFFYFISHRWGLTEQSRIACHSNFAFETTRVIVSAILCK